MGCLGVLAMLCWFGWSVVEMVNEAEIRKEYYLKVRHVVSDIKSYYYNDYLKILLSTHRTVGS